jgi:hypothetical protein
MAGNFAWPGIPLSIRPPCGPGGSQYLAVTAEAASDSRQKIRQAHRAGAGDIVVTGCWSTLDAQAPPGCPVCST